MKTQKTSNTSSKKASQANAVKKDTFKDISPDKTLVVVESPAKAKTINKYLGKNYIVEASVGHIKDLAKFRLGIDVENDFQPNYITIRGKSEIIKRLKKIAEKVNNVLIATDPDREGEAIAWHISEELKGKNSNIQRVVFNEITKNSIKKSIAEPRNIDLDVFHSQQARRVMDRIIGFKVSPFLSNALIATTTATLSAGRVQSVAMSMICDREVKINSFEPIEYWVINADFATKNNDIINCKLVAFDDKIIKNPEGSRKGEDAATTTQINETLNSLHYIKSQNEADNLLNRIKEQNYNISDIVKKQIKRKPASPFTTSLLQQDASRKLGFSSKKTMVIAQKLYEGINVGSDGTVGLITYMRTDSTRISQDALDSCRKHIENVFGKEYLPETPHVYSSKSTNIQDAHEAIRPTTIHYTPDYLKQYLDKEELALYGLIYNRFIASQMASAIIDQTTVSISSDDFVFRASGSVIVFRGFLALYEYQIDEESSGNTSKLPKDLQEKQDVNLEKTEETQTATKPLPRYTEASLVKELDELGIGRPSTYAQIVTTLFDRLYIKQVGKSLIPTELGVTVCDVLIDCFPDLFNVDFTAKMEADLDSIADGDMTYLSLMNDFYKPFTESLQKAEEKSKSMDKGIKCELCGGNLVIKVSRIGRFLGCENYPTCKNTKPLIDPSKANVEKKEPEIAEGIVCDECGSPMCVREGKFGKFYGCTQYPKCSGIKPIIKNVTCPQCNEGTLIERYSTKTRKKFWGCSNYPKCNYLTNNEPLNEQCPECQNPYLEIKYKKTNDGYQKYKNCPKCKTKFDM